MLPNPKAYEMNAAGEQSYKNEVDRYNQANPNGQIKYTARSTYNTPQPVTQTGNVYSVGPREFINKQDAQNWTNNPGLVNQQPQDLPVRTTQHIDLLTNSTLASDRATSAGFQPWQDTTGNRSLTYVPKTLQTGNDADPVWTAGGYTEREKAVLVNNYYKAHPELGVTPAQNMPLTDTDVAAQNSAEYKAQMDYLDAQNDFTVQKSREQTAGAQGAAKANIGAVNREGVQSSSNLATSAEIIKRFSANQSNLEAQLAEQKRQLQVAQNAGLTKQAEQIAASISSTQQTILANAERSTNEVKNIISQGGLVGLNDAQLEDLSASTNIPTYALKAIQKNQNLQYGTEQQKQQTQALDNVMTLASQGALTVPMAISMAKQYNLPLDGIMGVVQASQIAGAGKQVALAQAQQNLSDQVNHMTSAAAQNAARLADMYKAGVDPQIIAAFKEAAGITDYNDPLTKMKLQQAQAELYIKQKEANGIPVSIDDKLKYLEYSQKLQELSGGAQAYVPTKPIAGLNVSFDENGLNVSAPLDAQGNPVKFQCAEFVNRLYGMSSGASGGAGTTWQSKVDAINNNGGILAKDIIDPVNQIKPGMMFALRIGDPNVGHYGVVKSVAPDGTIQTIEANAHNDGKITNEIRNINSVGMYGFAPPPKNVQIVGGKGVVSKAEQIASDIMQPYSTLTTSQIPIAERADVEKVLNVKRAEALKNNDIVGLARASAGGKDLDATTLQKLEKTNMVMGELQDLSDALISEKTGPILGILRSNNPYDTKAVEIKAMIQGLVPTLARGVYGEVGVLTDQDIKNYIQTLPNLRSTDDQKKLLLDMTKRTLSRALEGTIKTQAMAGRDVSGFASILSNPKPVSNYSNLVKGGTTQDYSQNPEYAAW